MLLNLKTEYDEAPSTSHLVAIVGSCANRTAKTAEDSPTATTDETSVAIAKALPALEAGEARFKDADFGKEVSLTGLTIQTDDIFAISEIRALCKDSLMLLKTLQQSAAPFRIYSLPQIQLDTTVGGFGRGPGEYNYPEIYPYTGPEYLALIIDGMKESNTLQGITCDGSIENFATRIPESYFKYSYTHDFAAQNRDHLIFTFQSKIYRYDNSDPSLSADSVVRPIADLKYGKSGAGSTRYMGSLGVNFRHKRAVWAYKYDKWLLVTDFDGNARMIRFETPNDAVNEGISMDANITHYWKLYAGDKYFYVYYSGRTPVQVIAERSATYPNRISALPPDNRVR